MPGLDPAFLRSAVQVANESTVGTLGVNLVVHPAAEEEELGIALTEAVADLGRLLTLFAAEPSWTKLPAIFASCSACCGVPVDGRCDGTHRTEGGTGVTAVRRQRPARAAAAATAGPDEAPCRPVLLTAGATRLPLRGSPAWSLQETGLSTPTALMATRTTTTVSGGVTGLVP